MAGQGAQSRGRGREDEADEDAMAPKIPTKRTPFAYEVGPPPGAAVQSISPLPGLPLDTTFDNVSWIPQGPGLTQDGDLNIAPMHPTAGCVTAIAPHPTNQNVIYIGTANGGVWRTDNALDANVRWKPLTDDQLSLSIGGLAIDPTDATGNTLVAGIGRRSSYGGSGGALKGILRTTDGGATWTRLGEVDLAGRNVYQLAARGSTIVVCVPNTDNATAPGLYRSTNGGTTFTNVSGASGTGLLAGSVTHLAADPTNLARFYVHVASNGVYRTSDSGATWVNASPSGISPAQLALAVSGNGTAVFAGECTTTSRVWRSTNLGANWTQMNSVQTKSTNFWNGFVADPSNANLIYFSGSFVRSDFPFSGRVVRGDSSQPSGSQWTSIASTNVQGTGTAPHTDSRALAFTAGSRLIEGDDGGIYELPVANVGSEGMIVDGVGSEWRSLNGNLADSEMHSMAYDPVSRIFFGGAQDTGFQNQLTPGLAQAGGAGWEKVINGDGGAAAIEPVVVPGSSIRYGSAQYLAAFYHATYDAYNNETNFTLSPTTLVGSGTPIVQGNSSSMPFTSPIATNAVASGRIVIGGNTHLYESIDQGNTVTQIDTVGVNGLTKIAYGGRFNGANAPDVLFFGSGSNIRYRTMAGGAVNGIAFPGGNVQGIVFDPQNWKTAYIIGTTSVYSANDIATNGAAAFTNITGNLTGVGTMQTIQYLTLPSGNALMVGTDLGAFIMRTASPGVWKTLGDNLPRAPIHASAFDSLGQVLAVAAFGRGAWLYDCKQTKTTGQYGETFQAYDVGTSTFSSTTGELFSSQLGTATAVAVAGVRELRLTLDNVTNTLAAFRLPDTNAGKPVPAFSAKWNSIVFGNPSTMADGFSFNFGQLGGISGMAFTNGTYANEDGFNVGLTVSLRTYSGATPGYYVRVNGVTVPGGFVSKPSANWGTSNTTRHLFEVDWRKDTGLSLRVDGVAIFTNLATPGFITQAGDRFVFGARTGSFYEAITLDNIAIITGGVLLPLAPISRFMLAPIIRRPARRPIKRLMGTSQRTG